MYSLPAGYEATTGQTAAASQHNDPLEDLRDDANAARPIVSGGTGATSASGARAALGVPPVAIIGASSLYATCGGTANAVTLTTGLSLSSLTTGQEFRFRASSANTGAMTANVDGIGAVTVKTVTGAGTPSGYIRTDVDTIVRYDGTNFVASRGVESGSGANGIWTRFEDGTQVCANERLTLNFSTALRLAATWTFPAAFSATSYGVHASLRPELDAETSVDINADFDGNMASVGNLGHYSRTTSSVSFSLISTSSSFVTGNKGYASVIATGRWY